MEFENTEVFNFDGALRGMRNPLESWGKLDSYPLTYDGKNAHSYSGQIVGYNIGENDMKLAQRLILAGNEHSKFMRQIFVSVDITAPLYWYKEFDTYKIGTTANSTSTMHKIISKPITLNCFEWDKNDLPFHEEDYGVLYNINHFIVALVEDLERLRILYLNTKDKRYWKSLIQLLPSSWLQTRTVTMNYANLRNMWLQRKNHKLTEWSVDFIHWIETLPYAKELIMLEVD